MREGPTPHFRPQPTLNFEVATLADILVSTWCQNTAIFAVSAGSADFFGLYRQQFTYFCIHGMEEVVGSIPTRSTMFSTTYGFPLFPFGRKFTTLLLDFPRFGFFLSSLLTASTVARTLSGISCM
jgi:hypothetical protein